MHSQAFIENNSIPEPNSGCWLWLGSYASHGYGRFKFYGISYRAHRTSYEAYKGKIPENLLVRHLCHNKACVNPDHLALGTCLDNAKDQINVPLTEKFKAGRKNIQLLSDEKKEEIRIKYGNKKKHTRGGVTFESLAIEYGVSIKVIWRIINNGYSY